MTQATIIIGKVIHRSMIYSLSPYRALNDGSLEAPENPANFAPVGMEVHIFERQLNDYVVSYPNIFFKNSSLKWLAGRLQTKDVSVDPDQSINQSEEVVPPLPIATGTSAGNQTGLPEQTADQSIPIVSSKVKRFRDYIATHDAFIFGIAHPTSRLMSSSVEVTKQTSENAEIIQTYNWQFASASYVTKLRFNLYYHEESVIGGINMDVTETPSPQLAAFFPVGVTKTFATEYCAKLLNQHGKNGQAFALKLADKFVTTNQIIAIALSYLAN